MKTILTFFFMTIVAVCYSQTAYRSAQKMFNYSLSYGPRNKNTFYSTGYSFSKTGSMVSLEVGTGPIMLGLNMVNDIVLTINGRPSEIYAIGNYVYRNKKHNKYFLVGGIGKSLLNNDIFVLRVGGDLQITYPLYLSVHYYQTNVIDFNHFMIGGKMIIF